MHPDTLRVLARIASEERLQAAMTRAVVRHARLDHRARPGRIRSSLGGGMMRLGARIAGAGAVARPTPGMLR